jgi:hypothetical protein
MIVKCALTISSYNPPLVPFPFRNFTSQSIIPHFIAIGCRLQIYFLAAARASADVVFVLEGSLRYGSSVKTMAWMVTGTEEGRGAGLPLRAAVPVVPGTEEGEADWIQ